MDNVEFLKYLREDMQNMEKRLSDRMTNEISRIDCKIDSLNNNITKVYQDIYEIQKELLLLKEKVCNFVLTKDELEELQDKVNDLIKSVEQVKDRCDKFDVKEEISMKKKSEI